MKLDASVILILMRAVKKFGSHRVQNTIQRFFKEKERVTGKDYSLECRELCRLIFEL
jgi:hypothetical protein